MLPRSVNDIVFEILPGAASDAVAGIDGLRAVGCLGAEVGAPGLVARARRLSQGLALTIGSFQAAEVGAFARPTAGDEEGHVRRLRRRLLCQARVRAQRRNRNRRNNREEIGLGHVALPVRAGAPLLARLARI